MILEYTPLFAAQESKKVDLVGGMQTHSNMIYLVVPMLSAVMSVSSMCSIIFLLTKHVTPPDLLPHETSFSQKQENIYD